MTKCVDPITKSLKLIGGKWKFSIIYNLRAGPVRFGELKRTLAPITQQMLTKQLREMERDQLIHRKVFEVIPPKVEYSLTEFGISLGPGCLFGHPSAPLWDLCRAPWASLGRPLFLIENRNTFSENKS